MLTENTWLKDRYLIESYIHQGGMGAVYKAKNRLKGRTVAVKQSFFSQAHLRQQFVREATLLARLSHPALPEVYDYFLDGAEQFLVMQYVEGEDLERLLERQRGPLALDQVMGWADKVLDALHYLHTNQPPIIHRDIKPSNLKLKPNGEIILLDFGLAKNETTPTLPGGSLAAATLDYAPPEQLKKIDPKLDPNVRRALPGTDARCDLYSLGATLYHLLTNQAPTNALVRAAVIEHGTPDPLRSAHKINPRVHPSIAAVLQRAMALDREQRHASAAEMRQALRSATEPTVIAPPPRLTQPAPPQMPSPPQPKPQPPPLVSAEPTPREYQRSARSLRKPLIGAAITVPVVLLLAYLLWSATHPTPTVNPPQPATPSPSDTLSPVLHPRVEVLRYSLELEKPGGQRTADLRLAAGQKFKLHFTPREPGYLYLIAPNEQQTPTLFLKTDRLSAGLDFQFPEGGSWIEIDPAASQVNFTVIFSPQSITSPSFLSASVGYALKTDAEQQALQRFREQWARRAPETTGAEDNSQRVTALAEHDQPVVFDITVRRKSGS